MADFCSWRPEHRTRAIQAKKGIPDPPGFKIVADGAEVGKGRGQLDQATRARKEAALRQKAMDPGKQALFMGFMLYMSGNSLQIFSIMMLVSCIYSPISAIANLTKAFPADKNVDVTVPRLIYFGIQLGQLAFAAYKLNVMGLLPTYASDWMSQLPAPVLFESSAGPSN